MDYENRQHERRRSILRRVVAHGLLLILPGFAVGVFLMIRGHAPLFPIILFSALLALYFLLVTISLAETVARPLQTLSNVLSSLREGDYSFRARGAGSSDAFGELASEINSLANLLQEQRIQSLEATALLARILEVMHAPLFAFDRTKTLRLINDAGSRLLGRSAMRCYGRSADELHLDLLLDAPDQSMHSFGSSPNRWLLRKAHFRQDGAPHTLLLLADVSQPLQEEEKSAWRRLVHVLGHEISNSLAPIKSIAGSLHRRLEQLDGEGTELADFSRGLAVIESRAEALHRFIQSYRVLAQLPPPQQRPIPVKPLIERAVLLERRIPVRLEAGPDVTLSADSDQLEQLLINLLANAAEASLGNGSEPITVNWQTDAASLVIQIRDHGAGLANTANLFVPFYTTKPEGSGIGLALAQQIARAHGGEVTLENSEIGSGAVAKIRLPL